MATLYVLGRDERIACTMANHNGALNFRDDIATEDLTGADAFECTITNADHADARHVVEEALIVAIEDGEARVWKIKTLDEVEDASGHTKHITCETAAQELVGHFPIFVNTPTAGLFSDTSLAVIATAVLAGSRFALGDCPSHTGLTYDWQGARASGLERIRTLQSDTGLEMRYRYEWRNSAIIGRYVDFAVAFGADSGVVIEHGRNAISIGRTNDSTELCTALVPEGPETDGIPLSIVGVAGPTASGRGKDQANDYLGDPAALETYGLSTSPKTHIKRVFTSSTATTAAQLLAEADTELTRILDREAQATYDVAFVDLANLPPQISAADALTPNRVRLGDTALVRALHFTPPLDTRLRAIERRRSFSDPSAGGMTFGTRRDLLTDL